MSKKLAPSKVCPNCKNSLHAATRNCSCGHVFSTKHASFPNAKNVINKCLPDGWTYIGESTANDMTFYTAFHSERAPDTKTFRSLPDLFRFVYAVPSPNEKHYKL